MGSDLTMTDALPVSDAAREAAGFADCEFCRGAGGLAALVDDEHFDLVSAHKWYALRVKGSKTIYARTKIDGRTVYMHRLVMGEPEGLDVDHIDFNGLNTTRSPVLSDEWQPIETAPVGEPFLAAVQVVNNKTGAEWWEQHVIVLDSETGEVRHETDAGWSAGDYTHWRPLPAPPVIEALSRSPVEPRA